LRKNLNARASLRQISNPASHCDEEIVLVEADGYGGAVLRVVEGNYPMDFYTREEQAFPTEAEALRAAESFCELAV
jgi:hypothetical protein